MSIIHILGESAVRSLALALAVAIVLRVLRVQHARLAKRVWTAFLILALAMPALVALHIPSFSFTALWSTPRTVIVHAATPPSSTCNRHSARGRYPVGNRATPAQPEDFAPAVILNVPVPAGCKAHPRQSVTSRCGRSDSPPISRSPLCCFCASPRPRLAVRLWRRAQTFATSETDLPVRLSFDLRSPATVGHGILLPLEAIDWDDGRVASHARA